MLFFTRAKKTRVKEHTKAMIATIDKNSLLAQHHMLHQHEIDLEGVEITDRSTKLKQRLILPAWNSVRGKKDFLEAFKICHTIVIQ